MSKKRQPRPIEEKRKEAEGFVFVTKGGSQTHKFLATSKGVFPMSVLDRFEIRKKEPGAENRAVSQALKDETYMTEKNLVPYPFEVAGFLTLQDNCAFFDACVRQIAKDVTGQGYVIKLRKNVKEGDEAVKKAIEDFLSDPNTDEASTEDVLEHLIIDWGSTGWLCMEVGWGDDGTPDALYQLPAHTVKVHKDGNKYCQTRANKYRWFRKFGYEEYVNSETGEEAGDIPEEKRAHDLIFYRNYYAQSDWYGAPNVLPSVGAIEGLVGIRDYNLAFFNNYGIPAAVITLEGKWKKEHAKIISDFVDTEIKASNNAHKTIVINPPEGGKITWTPLVVEVKEGHFKLYFKQLRDEVLVCYRMPPYRIGIIEIGSLGGSTAAESTRIYIDSIVKPLQRVLNHIMTQKIIKDGFDSEDWEFVLNELDIRDMDTETARTSVQFGMGVLTRAMVAERLGLPEIPEADPYRDTYFISATYREVGTEPAQAGMAANDRAIEELQAKVAGVLKAKLEAARKAREAEAKELESEIGGR